MIPSVGPFRSGADCRCAPASLPPSTLQADLAAVAWARDLTGRMSITTAEGDTVTLTANLTERVRAAYDDESLVAAASQGSRRGIALDYSLSRSLGITVDGDLNEQEAREVSRLFAKVVKIVKRFFGGEEEAALAKTASLAERFQRSRTLADLDLQLSVERSVTVLAGRLLMSTENLATDGHQTRQPEGPVRTAPASDHGQDAPVPPTAQPPESGQASRQALSRPSTPLGPLVRLILEAVEHASLAPQKLARHLPRFFDRLTDDLAEPRFPGRERAQPVENNAGARPV